jgi:hypothetical protein
MRRLSTQVLKKVSTPLKCVRMMSSQNHAERRPAASAGFMVSGIRGFGGPRQTRLKDVVRAGFSCGKECAVWLWIFDATASIANMTGLEVEDSRAQMPRAGLYELSRQYRRVVRQLRSALGFVVRTNEYTFTLRDSERHENQPRSLHVCCC